MRLFILANALLFFIPTIAQKKVALIVAVGTYMPGSGIPTIASVKDVKYIKEVLKNNGFAEKDIDTLKDSKATKSAILKSLDAITAKVKKGDIVLLHFSGHGQQIRDQKTVELGKDEEDGLDEAFLPYDVKKGQYYPQVYTGENHLRDDELGEKLIAIRNSLGSTGSLLVLIDACHSGTATRSQEFTSSRGEPEPFKDPENPMESMINLPDEDHFFDNISDSASNMIVISGSGPHQVNFQTEITVGGVKEQVGTLSYSFYKAMNDLPPESDYELLFQKIKASVQAQHPTQFPLIEGNTSQIVFNGRYKPKKEIIFLTAVTDQRATSDTIFKIDKGIMDGIGEGTTVQIFTTGNNTPIAEGMIKRSEHFIAYGVSNKTLDKGIVYEAKLDNVNFGSFGASIKIKRNPKDAVGGKLEKQIQSIIKPYKFISISENAEMMVDLSKPSAGGIDISLVDIIDSVRWRKSVKNGDSLSSEDAKNLLASIRNFMRIKYLRTMPDGGNLSKFLTTEIIPSKPFTGTGEMIMETGEEFSLKIENNSSQKLFYTVLDISPDNVVDILYPSKGKEPANYSIEKNGSVIRKLRVSKSTPVGKEFLKIIISKEPMDLRSVLEHKTQRSQMVSFQAALDDLFNDTNDERSTRGSINSIKAEEVGISTVSFTVKQK